MDFRDLLSSLLPKAARWDSLGIQLGLSPDELDIIRADSMGVEDCLRKMLKKWYDRTLDPTWQKIIAALMAMDEVKLARDLQSTKISDLANRG